MFETSETTVWNLLIYFLNKILHTYALCRIITIISKISRIVEKNDESFKSCCLSKLIRIKDVRQRWINFIGFMNNVFDVFTFLA